MLILWYPSWKEEVCKICKMIKFYKNLYNMTACVDFVISFVLSRVWDEKRQFARRSPKWVGVIPQMSHPLPQQKVALLFMFHTWERERYIFKSMIRMAFMKNIQKGVFHVFITFFKKKFSCGLQWLILQMSVICFRNKKLLCF